MLVEAPHILLARTLSAVNDEYGRQVSSTESWEEVGECFCHDNSQQKEVSVNGKLWVYSYHVVYEGGKIPLDTMVRCLNQDGNTVGDGRVIKNAECYSEELRGRCDIWLE